MSITVQSPITIAFARAGGTDIQAEVQIWLKKAAYGPQDRPVARVPFQQATQAHEQQAVSLARGQYVCVHLSLVREALNGQFAMSTSMNGQVVQSEQGDVNHTASPHDMKSGKQVFDMTVA